MTAAIDRFKAAFTQYNDDLFAQLGALSTLAKHGAEDLDTAGGSGSGSPAGGPSGRP